MKSKLVYSFGGGKSEADIGMKNLFGGKGASLADMAGQGLPVPPGFLIAVRAHQLFCENREKLPTDVNREIERGLARLEKLTGRKLGDPKNPLLVSVRPSACFAMPGTINTVLNLGLNDKSVEGLATVSGSARFAYSCYCRFISLFANVVLGVPIEPFLQILEEKKRDVGASDESGLGDGDLVDICRKYKALVKERHGKELPQVPAVQLAMARDAMFRSWDIESARSYRKLRKIPEETGTGVIVQAMVFGNAGKDSAAGVWFTRNPSTGAKEFCGEYRVDSQGTDMVAGLRTPSPIRNMKKEFPKAYDQLARISGRLEKRYKTVLSFEFTIEKNALYMLRVRQGERSAAAAFRMVVDMVKEKILTREEALLGVSARQVEQLLHPVVDPEAKVDVIAAGLPASPGAATGVIVFSADKAMERAMSGKDVILVRREISPEDIRVMEIVSGILTEKGGMTSHTAVIARQMGKTCVTGCEAIDVDEATGRFIAGTRVLHEGDEITLNGASGEVIFGKVPLTVPKMTGAFGVILSWGDSVRRLKVRANVDTPRDARVARDFGAEGIGLCRTQHMFFSEDRLSIMRELILAATKEERDAALARLLPMQRDDFKKLYREMKGHPVKIRLLDPPLNEFLPKRADLLVEIAKLEFSRADRTHIDEKRMVLARVEELQEINPMLGMRGCRLGICFPEITVMQVKAIFEAACEAARERIAVRPEIMVPLVSLVSEMRAQKDIIRQVADETMKRYKRKIAYSVGAMIEVPRAIITAGDIAREAEFFSFGTNDLTQTTFGFSRDDAGKFIQNYLSRSELCQRCGGKIGKDLSCASCEAKYLRKAENILESDVFHTLDVEGVGEFIRLAAEKGRSVRPNLKLGVCGEHGGEPRSVEFFDRVGLDYVSCSPYSVPVARLAAAQSALRRRMEGKKRKK